MSRHGFILPFLMTAFMIVVCSCMPQTSLPTIKAHPDKTTIRIWLWQGSGLESLIQAYKDSHQGIDVEIVTSQYDDIQPNLMIAFATRSDSPDLVLLDSSQINQMKNFPAYFHNLYEYGDEHVHYLDWKWRQAESDDGSFLFALPADIGPVALAYRFDLFAAAGLPAGRTEITAMLGSWDDLERLGIALKEKSGIPLFDNLTNIYLSYLNQYVQPHSDKSGNESVARFKEAWDRTIRFHKLGLSAGLQSQTQVWASGAVNGRFAAVLGPSWVHGLMKKNAPATAGKWDLARPPGEPSNWDGTFIAVPAASRYPQEAYELARWLTAPPRQLDNFIQNGNFPSTPESYASSEFIGIHDPFFNNAPTGQIYSYTALRYKGGFEDADMTITDRLIRDALQRVETEGADPDLMWESVMEEIGSGTGSSN